MKKILATALMFFFLIMQAAVFSQEEVELTIKDYLEKALPPQEGRRVVYNEQAKLLTVTDTKSNHRLIKQLIEQFEVGPRQVMIEARFVEVDITDLSELGIEWDWYIASDYGKRKIGKIGVGRSTVQDYHGIHWDDSTSISFPKVGNIAGQFFISKISEGGDFIQANLRALEQQGKTNLLSAPKVTTVSGQMANIQVVRNNPYVSDFTLENLGTADHPIWNYRLTLSEKPVGIILEVTPYVSEGSNTIILDIHPEVSVLKDQVLITNLRATGTTGQDIEAASISIGGGFAGQATAALEAGTDTLISSDLGWPVVDVRSTQTSIAIDSGATIVLGGMIKDEEVVTKRKVPILGDIPLLGRAFRYDYVKQRKKNLLIFITASIITAEGEVIR